MTFNNND